MDLNEFKDYVNTPEWAEEIRKAQEQERLRKKSTAKELTPEEQAKLDAELEAYAQEAARIFGGSGYKPDSSAKAVIGSPTPSKKDSPDPDGSGVPFYSDWSPAAKMFGMDQSTAYAEHMANTAHQREVADLRAAGLNPVLGISGSGASGVSGSVSSGSSSAQKGLSFDSLVDLFGATASVVTMLLTKNPTLGYSVGRMAQAGGNLLFADK